MRPATVRVFAPEYWGQVELFSKFCAGTYALTEQQQRELAGVSQHFEKAVIFQRLAEKLRPNVEIDRTQLNNLGFTPAENSRELGAVIEAAIVELYSSLDCAAAVLHAIYGGHRATSKNRPGGYLKTTQKLNAVFPTN